MSPWTCRAFREDGSEADAERAVAEDSSTLTCDSDVGRSKMAANGGATDAASTSLDSSPLPGAEPVSSDADILRFIPLRPLGRVTVMLESWLKRVDRTSTERSGDLADTPCLGLLVPDSDDVTPSLIPSCDVDAGGISFSLCRLARPEVGLCCAGSHVSIISAVRTSI